MMKRENAILAVWMGIFALPFLGNGNLWVAETAAIASAKAAESKAPQVENVIRGSIELAPALAEKVAPGSSIFVVARPANGRMPLAVAKLPMPETFPLTFELTEANVMVRGVKLEGDVEISARIDRDGEAMSKTAGDIIGDASTATVPVDGVKVLLDTVIE